MSIHLKGKFLVRKAKMENGEERLILAGTFIPNFNISEIKSNDEMWVAELKILEGGLRFTNPYTTDGGSPEDFLCGNNQSPKCWKNKSNLLL